VIALGLAGGVMMTDSRMERTKRLYRSVSYFDSVLMVTGEDEGGVDKQR
jgi:hypothetical protein